MALGAMRLMQAERETCCGSAAVRYLSEGDRNLIRAGAPA
jgi:hypothetical protein